MSLKSSVVLLEFILSVVLFSILLLMVVNTSWSLYQKNGRETFQTYTNLQLETTRLFFTKQDISKITYRDNTLYFEDDLLLKEVSSYGIVQSGVVVSVDICVENDTICQEWKIRK